MKTSANSIKLLFILFFSATGMLVQAQDPSSKLDLESTTQGILIPRMTTAEQTAISSSAQSLFVYDTDTKTFYYYENGVWNELEQMVG